MTNRNQVKDDLIDIRYRIEAALKTHGAKIGDCGFGFHPLEADIDFEVKGQQYSINIRHTQRPGDDLFG